MCFLFDYKNYFDANLHEYMFLLNVGVWEHKNIWGEDHLYHHGAGYEDKNFVKRYDTNLIFKL